MGVDEEDKMDDEEVEEVEEDVIGLLGVPEFDVVGRGVVEVGDGCGGGGGLDEEDLEVVEEGVVEEVVVLTDELEVVVTARKFPASLQGAVATGLAGPTKLLYTVG